MLQFSHLLCAVRNVLLLFQVKNDRQDGNRTLIWYSLTRESRFVLWRSHQPCDNAINLWCDIFIFGLFANYFIEIFFFSVPSSFPLLNSFIFLLKSKIRSLQMRIEFDFFRYIKSHISNKFSKQLENWPNFNRKLKPLPFDFKTILTLKFSIVVLFAWLRPIDFTSTFGRKFVAICTPYGVTFFRLIIAMNRKVASKNAFLEPPKKNHPKNALLLTHGNPQ